MQEQEVLKVADSTNSTVSVNTLNWQVKLFLFALLIPTEFSFNVGEFRFSAYRVFLLLAFFPCFFRAVQGRAGRTLPTDWLLFGYSCWIVLALTMNMGFEGGLKSGGILVVESYGAYLLARAFIRNEQDYAGFVKLLVLVIIGLSLITIPEALTGKNLLRPLAGHIGGRLGLTRALGPFDHPILYGIFCASAVSLAMYVPIKNLLEQGAHVGRGLWVTVAAFMSVSSGALATCLVQLVLALWNRMTRGMAAKWWVFSILLVLAYITIDLLSNRTPMRVILHRLTFSAHTAYNRLTTWEWGIKYNVAENPWFGSGFAEWVRPSWMHSTSIDNFWLVTMVKYGLPTFLLMAAGGILLMITVMRKANLSEPAKLMRTGWGFSMIGLIIGGCTVHFWNQLHVWFFFLLGSGAWMAAQDRGTAADAVPREESSRA